MENFYMSKSSVNEEKGTILLVDDDAMVLDVIGIIIKGLGYSVLVAKDGIDAVRIFIQHQSNIVCVLSDLTMPNMDGMQIMIALRKISPKIPVIISSGFHDEERINNRIESPNAFLRKPYDIKQLREILSKVIETDGEETL
jgi:CheY-like chemotaxis protein